MAGRGNPADSPEWGLFIRENKKDMDARKSIKVKLPIRQHIRLHAMKLFSENNISETVEAALDQYFARMKEEEEARQAESAENGDLQGPATQVAGPIQKLDGDRV